MFNPRLEKRSIRLRFFFARLYGPYVPRSWTIILNQFLIGVGFGWTGPTLPKLRSADSTILNLSSDQATWLASIHEVGKFVCPLISLLVVDRIGRKSTVILASVLYFAIFTTVIFARDIYILYAARFIFGLANGLHDVVASIYIAENCSPSLRGIMASCVVLTFFGAVLFEYTIATYLSYVNTAIVNTVIAGCALTALYFGVETPYFLIMRGEYKEAKKNLLWLRNGVCQDETIDELDKIERSVLREMLKGRNALKSAANLKALCVVIVMSLLGVATGSCVYVTYPTSIFSSSETFKTYHFSIFYSALQFVVVLVSPFIIEKIDRRTLIIGSFFGMTCSNICSYALIHSHACDCNMMFYPWLIFASVAVYGTFSSITSTAECAVKGELLPLSVKALGCSMCVVSQSMSSFCVLKMFSAISGRYGVETNFLIYSIASALATVFLYFVLPETRGKSLYEIQNSLRATRPTSDSKEETVKIVD